MREDDRDPLDRPVHEPARNNPIGGLFAMIAGLIGVCVVGLGFDLFGKPIAFDGPGPYLFYGSIWLGVFGIVWSVASAWTAFRATVIVASIFLALFLAGKISRGEL